MIDVHAHFVPPELPFGTFKGGDWPRVEVSGDKAEVYTGTRHFRSITSSSWDLSRRIEDMDAHGVDGQAISPMPELFCYWADPADAVAYCRELNHWLAERIKVGAGRFHGLGLVPLQAPERAAELLEEVLRLGLRGVEIGSNVNGVPLHDRRFDVFFGEANRLGLAIFVHAFHPHLFESITGAPAASAVTFPNEIGFAAGGLIAEGVVHRYPRLRICASHGAGSLTLLLPRMDRMYDFDPASQERMPERPSAGARRLFVDLLVFSPDALSYVIRTLGCDRVVVGSDYPFMSDRPGKLLDEIPIEAQERAQIERDNALAFLGVTQHETDRLDHTSTS